MTECIYNIEPPVSRLADMVGMFRRAPVKWYGRLLQPEIETELKAISALRFGNLDRIFCLLLIKSFNNNVELPP